MQEQLPRDVFKELTWMYSQRVSGGITRPGMVRVWKIANPKPTPAPSWCFVQDSGGTNDVIVGALYLLGFTRLRMQNRPGVSALHVAG